MPRRLSLTDLQQIPAMQWPDVTAGLLAEARPRITVARLTGGVVALGRFQRASIALTDRGRQARIVRRITGGRTLALGDGIIALAISLPHRAWLTGEALDVVPAAKFLNRSVRGILMGLTSLGAPAQYFGRDFITAAEGQAAHLSFEFDRAGHALLECLIAVEAHWTLPAECDASPARAPLRGVPGPSQLSALEGITNGKVLDAIGAGCARWFGLETVVDDAPVSLAPFSEAEPELPSWSPPAEVAIGRVQVGAATEGDRLTHVALRGDFLADSPGVHALESAIIEGPGTLEQISKLFNTAALSEEHTMLGIADLRVWAEAFRALGVR